MTFAEVQQLIGEEFGAEVIENQDAGASQPWLQIATGRLAEVCLYLRNEDSLLFDFLHNLSGVDYGEKENALGVVYHLGSLIHEHQLVLKVRISRQNPDPVPSVSNVWRAADWHEREAYDLIGIPFTGHPDLRRILMPADWEGHPLRKDYENQDTYHDIPIEYGEGKEGSEPLK